MPEPREAFDAGLAPRIPTEPGEPGNGDPTPTVRVGIRMERPVQGAVIAGPSGAVPVTVSGTASCLVDLEEAIGFLEKVEVRLGDAGAFERAEPTGPGGDWSSWSFRRNVAASGPLNVTAKATSKRLGPTSPGRTASDSASVSVQFDTTAPQLAVDSLPNGGKVYGDTEKIRTAVTGTASDSQTGIAWVACDVDGVEPP